MRAISAERYVNKKMEKELQQYKLEIENRFKKSNLRNYVFPFVRQIPELVVDVKPKQEKQKLHNLSKEASLIDFQPLIDQKTPTQLRGIGVPQNT